MSQNKKPMQRCSRMGFRFIYIESTGLRLREDSSSLIDSGQCIIQLSTIN